MNSGWIVQTAGEQKLKESQVQAVASLLGGGATIPFIARYRKEATGSLDEVAVARIRDRLAQLSELDDRRESILKSLEQHGHLTDDLKKKILAAGTLSVLEDIYLPYKPKRRTRATMAREKGLEPLALLIMEQRGINPFREAEGFLDKEKGVHSIDEALAGARDIIAEMVNEDSKGRAHVRQLFLEKGICTSSVVRGKESEGAKYRDYFHWEEPAAGIPSHRILAMQRGEREGILNLSILPPEEDALRILQGLFVKGKQEDSNQVRMAIHDCYQRLLSRSMENERRASIKKKADAEAIKVFAANLHQLLLAPPLGSKRVMGIDPGYKTGCKVACLDRQGNLLHHDTIYPHSTEGASGARAKVEHMCQQFQVEAIAIGNGTAGRQTEAFIRGISLPKKPRVFMVDESGASIYSASEAAREEFPEYDLTVRGAISIGRRLMDPLSELVKIDPKSIGVGQYQHDVNQAALKQSLDDVVISCVNSVGVDINRASVQILSYVSGLGPRIARSMVAYRSEHGPFHNRNELKKVPYVGPKAFEQSAGFLRIKDGENPLDASAVHPESYHLVEAMAHDLGCRVSDLMKNPDMRDRIDISKYVTGNIGLPTLRDILAELARPGLDPREDLQEFAFAEGIENIKDVREGMKLPGIVTNITAFGAFVDIGVHQDGLVHISELADHFVKDPSTVVRLHQKVTVTVKGVDIERNRISLSMKKPG
ncbi:MAG: Tex family protein [bacterium]